MAAIALALGASLTWGFADFFGPLKGRTLGVLRVLVYVQLGGLLGIALIVAVRGKGPDGAATLLAIPAAFSGTIGLYAYYRGMQVGAMSIVAPIAGMAAAVPVAFGIATGDRPSTWQLLGIAFALGGVFLAAREPAAERLVREADRWRGPGGSAQRSSAPADQWRGPGGTGRFPQRQAEPSEGTGRFPQLGAKREGPPASERARSKLAPGVGLALLAAIGFGGYFPPMHAAGDADFWWASLIFRLTSTSVILTTVAIRRPSLAIAPLQFPALALIGIGDMLGNLLYAAASTSGLISVTSVLASLFPIVTVVLARLVLKEKVARSQEAGIVLTLAAVTLISAG
jgi:drug/metabolite transporter (DMT)-like permease